MGYFPVGLSDDHHGALPVSATPSFSQPESVLMTMADIFSSSTESEYEEHQGSLRTDRSGFEQLGCTRTDVPEEWIYLRGRKHETLG